MRLLDLATILCIGLMTGNEFAVSAFVNPAVWTLDPPSQAKACKHLARTLGTVMPLWYGLSLALLAAVAYTRRDLAGAPWLYGAIAIWVLAIVFSLTVLVPINNRITALDLDSPPPHWRMAHKRWDKLHRWRIAMLAIAVAFAIWGVLGA